LECRANQRLRDWGRRPFIRHQSHYSQLELFLLGSLVVSENKIAGSAEQMWPRIIE
jgi:hypothetical protein